MPSLLITTFFHEARSIKTFNSLATDRFCLVSFLRTDRFQPFLNNHLKKSSEDITVIFYIQEVELLAFILKK